VKFRPDQILQDGTDFLFGNFAFASGVLRLNWRELLFGEATG